MEAGVYSSKDILLADPTVLALIENMGAWQATVLHNYAKHVILPILGLQGTYQEDENVDEDPISVPPTSNNPSILGNLLSTVSTRSKGSATQIYPLHHLKTILVNTWLIIRTPTSSLTMELQEWRMTRAMVSILMKTSFIQRMPRVSKLVRSFKQEDCLSLWLFPFLWPFSLPLVSTNLVYPFS